MLTETILLQREVQVLCYEFQELQTSAHIVRDSMELSMMMSIEHGLLCFV